MHATVELRNVVLAYGGTRRVDDLTLDIEAGRIFGLLGPNGAGKTTTVNLITGMLEPDAGQVRVAGLDPVRDARQVRRLIGLVTQDTALYPELSARENLRFHGALYLDDLRPLATRIDHILDLVELRDRSQEPVKNFSGGMKRRLAIGRAMLHEPKLLLLDEPTLGVDVQGSYRIWDYIGTLRDSGMTVVVTTKNMGEADYLCDELAIIDHGALVTQGTPAALKATHGAQTLGEVFLAETGRELRDAAV